MTPRPRDANGETYVDHLANGIAPIYMLTKAPDAFTREDALSFIEGCRARLDKAERMLGKEND